MVEFNFYLSDEDFDRLYDLKEKAGKHSMTGNEYARELLEDTLYRLHPQRVHNDDTDDE